MSFFLCLLALCNLTNHAQEGLCINSQIVPSHDYHQSYFINQTMLVAKC
jgi:hypothetical protein